MSEPIAIPEEFNKVIKDFVFDIRNTFPEYDALINKWWKTPESFDNIENNEVNIENNNIFMVNPKNKISSFNDEMIEILFQNK